MWVPLAPKSIYVQLLADVLRHLNVLSALGPSSGLGYCSLCVCAFFTDGVNSSLLVNPDS